MASYSLHPRWYRIPSPMANRRWILSSDPIHITDCIHDCYASAFRLTPPPPSSATDSSSGHRLFANIFIAAASVASAVFFLALIYYTVLVRRRRADEVPSVGDEGPSQAEEAGVDYHVWHIRTVGLDESTINSISVKPYVTGGASSADCSVCLGELRDGELVRLLPACGHAFHVLCIDTWLRAHVNCPLCRGQIPNPAGGREGLVSSSPGAVTLMENQRVSQDLEEDRAIETRTEAVTHSSSDCNGNSILQSPSNLLENGSRQEFRSNSMDSSPGNDFSVNAGGEGRSEEEEEKEQEHNFSDEDGVNGKKEKQGCSSKGGFQQRMLPEFGAESTSGSGRVFFFSRYGRARSSSILPF